MNTCIACGEDKNNEEILMNGYKEPLCVVCEKEIKEEAIEAMNDICKKVNA